jgi:hypothetical protein
MKYDKSILEAKAVNDENIFSAFGGFICIKLKL